MINWSEWPRFMYVMQADGASAISTAKLHPTTHRMAADGYYISPTGLWSCWVTGIKLHLGVFLLTWMISLQKQMSYVAVQCRLKPTSKHWNLIHSHVRSNVYLNTRTENPLRSFRKKTDKKLFFKQKEHTDKCTVSTIYTQCILRATHESFWTRAPQVGSLLFTLQQRFNVFNSMLWGDSNNMVQSIESTQKLHHLFDVFPV